MDREKVIRAFEQYVYNFVELTTTDEYNHQILEQVLALLKEQEAVEPITEHHLFLCPVCKNTLFREQKFCHECGKRIEWEGR